MSVARILSQKGGDTVTIGAEASLADAAAELDRHRIGALVITGQDGSVRGILSERDIVRALAERGGEGLADTVGSRMSQRVTTCTAETTIPELMASMTEGKFRHVPVVRGGRLAGMVSIGDVVKHRLAEMEAEHQALRDYIATG